MNTLDRLPPSEQKKIAAWTICRPYGDRPLADWRIDAFNNPIRRSDYGKQTEYGWEIDQGMVLRDGEQHLVFFHFDEYVWNRWFRVTVKRCNEQRKLWVSTFHKTKWGQVRGKLKRLELLREEKR